MSGRRIAAALVAALASAGCTLPLPALTTPADVACRLDTEFRGYTRDPGPHRHYPAVCAGKPYELEEFKPGANANDSVEIGYQRWSELWTSTCVTAKAGDWVKLTPNKGGNWNCEVVAP